MKNITFLINSLTQGGAEKIALKLYKNISNMDRERAIDFVTLTNDDFYKEKINKKTLNNSDKISKFKKIKSLIKYFRGGCNPVLCFSLDLAFYMNVLKLLGIFKGRVICRFINNPDNEVGSSFINYLKKKILFVFIKRSDLIICQSNAMRDLLITKYKFEAKNTIRIYNPVSLKNNNIQIDGDDDLLIKLLFVGRLSQQKNLEDIINVANILRQEKINFTWKIVGDGELKTYFEHLIEKNELNQNIELCGSSSCVIDYYKWADMTTLLSHYEGLPNVLLESIACRTPCISYDCPTGPAEIILNGENGILVPLYDVKKFANSIYELKCLNLKNKCIEQSILSFSEEKIYMAYHEEIYKRLAD